MLQLHSARRLCFGYYAIETSHHGQILNQICNVYCMKVHILFMCVVVLSWCKTTLVMQNYWILLSFLCSVQLVLSECGWSTFIFMLIALLLRSVGVELHRFLSQLSRGSSSSSSIHTEPILHNNHIKTMHKYIAGQTMCTYTYKHTYMNMDINRVYSSLIV